MTYNSRQGGKRNHTPYPSHNNQNTQNFQNFMSAPEQSTMSYSGYQHSYANNGSDSREEPILFTTPGAHGTSGPTFRFRKLNLWSTSSYELPDWMDRFRIFANQPVSTSYMSNHPHCSHTHASWVIQPSYSIVLNTL